MNFIKPDSVLLSETFSSCDAAVKKLILMTLKKAKQTGIKTGLYCQARSDYADFASFLVDNSIGSISFNPDTLFAGIENINRSETKFSHALEYY